MDDTSVIDPTCVPRVQISNTEIVTNTTGIEETFGCVVEVAYPEYCEDKVVGMTVIGDETDPGSIKIRPPDDCGASGAALTTTGTWEASGANALYCDADTNTTDTLMCNSAIDAASGPWRIFFPDPVSDCSEWGDLQVIFMLPSEDTCDPPPDTPTDDCYADEDVTVHFINRSMYNWNGDGEDHSHLLPVVESGADFTERAWLRSITVTDWGDAEHLYLLRFGGHRMHYAGGDTVIEDAGIVTLDALDDSLTFDPGDIHMGTTFATDATSTTDPNFEPPTVLMDWSCEVPTYPNPSHFSVMGLPQAYGIRLSELGIYGMDWDQRIKMRIFGLSGFAQFELEGRVHDAVTIPIVQDGSDWLFDYDMPGVGIDAAGTIEPDGGDKEIVFERLILRGEDLGTPTWPLEQISE